MEVYTATGYNEFDPTFRILNQFEKQSRETFETENEFLNYFSELDLQVMPLPLINDKPVTKIQKKEYWSRDKTLLRGKKLCHFILFVLKEMLIIDCVSVIMPLIYDYVHGYGARVTTLGGKRDCKNLLDGPLETAEFDNPFGIFFDRNYNLLISEFGSHTIRMVSAEDNCVRTIAGKPNEKGNSDGVGNDATFWIPVQFCEDRDGNYLVVDSFNNNYRKVSLVDGEYHVKTVNLGTDSLEFPNQLNACHDITLDNFGNIVGSDTCNHRIIKITNKNEFIEYSGELNASGYKDGPLKEARWNKPAGIVVDQHGDIIICDYQNHCVRKIDTKTDTVTTIAGRGEVEGYKDGPATEALFCHPNAVCLGLDGDLLVADTDNFCIRLISNGMVTTLAGTTKMGSDDGDALQSTFNYPVNLCVDYRGDVFVTDWKNNLIRKIEYSY